MDESDDNFSNLASSSHRESYFTDEDNMSGSGKLSETSLSPTNQQERDEILKCKNCNSVFSNKQTLLIHVRTSVKCYSNKTNADSSKICSYCEKKFASKQMRLYHETKCVCKIINDLTEKHSREMERVTNELESLRQTINDIQQQKRK